MKALRLLLAVSMVSMLAACATSGNTEEQADITGTDEVVTEETASQSYTMDEVSTSEDALNDVSAGEQVDKTVSQETSLGASSSGLGR